MSTRASYTFADVNSVHHVYKHHDGYPSGAAQAIANALPNAWPLPRFEADEFAAAFVAGNKNNMAGGIRLMREWMDAWDIEYHYVITSKKPSDAVASVQNPLDDGADGLHVVAYAVNKPMKGDWEVEQIFAGSLAEFTEVNDGNK